MRARAEIQETKNGRFSIVVSELPYQVNKARLIENIAELVKEKRIEGISDINDYTSREGMHMVVDLKRDANPQVVLNQLYTFTQMQTTFGVIMLALVNGEPRVLTLKEVLRNYIDFQCEVVVRRTRYDLRKAQERAHILEGLLIAWILSMKSSRFCAPQKTSRKAVNGLCSALALTNPKRRPLCKCVLVN